MQFKVKNYILITYDQIKNNPSETLMYIKEMFNLNFKNSDIKTYKFYKNTNEKFRQKKYNHFEQDEIYLHPDYAHDVETKLRFL